MRCKLTGSVLDPIDAMECDGNCEKCDIFSENGTFPAHLLPVFAEKEAKPAPKKDRSRQKKWDRNGLRTVSARLPTRTAERFAAYCAARGKSRHAVIREWINEALRPVTGLSTVHKTGKDRWGKI